MKIIVLAGFVYFAADAFLNRAIRHPPGILVTEEPKQKDLPSSVPAILFKGDPLQPLAEYSLKARVLSKERYRLDWGAKYAPWDLAVGWKDMSDSRILDRLEISQMGRWYFINWRNSPLATDEILKNSSNVHVIPADESVKNTLDKVRVGHIVRMSGYLVRVDARDGGEWRSSVSRDDRFSGACEIMYVRSIELL
ncbi:MAG TPA: hypothetical protein PKC28_10190 [Bdellovibrionales bacterium]|nr:hypothetical protein [Bdellovibrionales bacterium]